MRKVELGNTKERISIIGQGTWGISRFFKDQEYYDQWKESLKTGIELGMTHIDTAEVYGWGKAEKIVGKVIKEYDRDELFITSKILPIHFRRKTMKKAAEKSLNRLDIDHFDLYIIHWPNPLISLEKQMGVMEKLVREGKTRYIGVSNFSVEQFKKAQKLLKKGELINNQLNASIIHQKHIFKSLPYYQDKNLTMTAYSPLGHEGLTDLSGDIKDKLENIADKYDATIQQIAIAWLINHQNVITIPKAFQTKHVRANAEAASIYLTKEEIQLFYKKSIDLKLENNTE
ncbi:MAG: aldo/keto reductase [Candidatus Lokiarchaeota archaeon]|nr:aldo/keto reductase [Candidatus Lokiarchaeota archaeon]